MENKEHRHKARRSPVGPGKRLVCIYADERLHVRIKQRADELGFSVSEYFQRLCISEMAGAAEIDVSLSALVAPNTQMATMSRP